MTGHGGLAAAAAVAQPRPFDRQESLEVVRLLLAAGADPKRKDAAGNTALSRAAALGREQTLRLLR